MHRRQLLIAAGLAPFAGAARAQRLHIEGIANPPGQITRIQDIRFENLDFEQPVGERRVPGWSLTQHAGAPAYEMVIDDRIRAGGKQSFRMRQTREEYYGFAEQRILIARGLLDDREVELSAMMRSAEVGPKGWLLTVACFSAQNASLGEFRSAPLTGTQDWRRVTVRAKVPRDTRTLSIGALLLDNGTGWLDDVEFRLAGRGASAEPAPQGGS